ncbi:MAG: TIGR02996 domain-containing protein [Myxococcota bacterium]
MRHVRWTDDGRVKLAALLSAANARRTSRVLSMELVEASARAALGAPLGYHWATGGDAPDARGLTTICLSVVRGDEVVVGVAAVHGAPTPANAWPELGSWQLYDDAENVPGLQAWAGRRREDRVAIAVTPASSAGSRDELLAAILARPDDDGPRLVLADLLLEAGDPRGEFIQLQCAGETERSSELLREHGARWLGELSPEVARVEFSRGFVSSIELLDARALAQVTALAEREPVVSFRVSSERLFDAARFAASAWSSRLTSLSFERDFGVGALSVEQLGRLLSSRHLRRLSCLSLRGQRLGDEGLRLLVERAPATLPGLAELRLERDSLTVAAARALSSSRWVAALRTLSLADNALGADGAELLATSTLASRHAVLSLAGNQVGNDGAIAFARATRFRGLSRLSLARNRISASGLEALLSSETLRGLVSLDLEGNPLGAAGRERLRGRFPSTGETR